MSVSISISNGRPIRHEETARIEKLKREQAEEEKKPAELRKHQWIITSQRA